MGKIRSPYFFNLRFIFVYISVYRCVYKLLAEHQKNYRVLSDVVATTWTISMEMDVDSASA